MAERSDRELLEAFRRAGDRPAMEELVLRHHRAAYRLAYRILGNEHDACDALQEATLRIMRSARAYRGDGPVGGWMRRAVASAALDQARRRGRRGRHEAAAARGRGGEGMKEQPAFERAEALRELRAELGGLPARLRAAAVLRYAEGMTDAEAAAALGWSRRTFSARARRALEKLRERFGRRKELAGAAALIPGLMGELPAPAAPAALAGALKATVLAGKLAAPLWWLAAVSGGKMMISKPGIAAVCTLVLAVGGAAVGMKSGGRAPAANAAAAAQPAADRGGAAVRTAPVEKLTDRVTQGALRFKGAGGKYVECPLKHTGVRAAVSGFIARVKVVQTFFNPSKENIEAVYVFPLPHKSAVEGMNMLVGDRKIVGLIKRRAAAEQIYQQAIAAGQLAAVLHQERPNIFTQKVGNIRPGQTVRIEISYVDVLEYDMGEYAFHFPMVVGPRFNPPGHTDGVGAVPAGAPAGAGGQPVEVNYLKPGQRSGHDISLSVELDAGVPIQKLKSVNHQVDMKQTGERTAKCSIKPADGIPNKDFELRYCVVGKKPEMAVLAHAGSGRDGYFMLMIQPSDDEALRKAPPRELTFLVDVSGSMSGRPTQQVKLALKHFLAQASPRDRIQLITFAGTPYNVFKQPAPATAGNIRKLLAYSRNYQAGGGTMMLPAVRKALGEKLEGDRVRIVIMLTDGYIGNEKQIIEEVGKRCGDRIRFWCLGVGTSVNRLLVDGVAKQGGGMSKVLSINESEEAVKDLVTKIMFRIHRAQLAGISINWGALKVYETYPERIPELWAGRPVVVYGRYSGGGRARIRVSGEAEGRPVSWPLAVSLSAKEPANDVLAATWARRKIESYMDQIWVDGSPGLVEEVTEIALEYKLMSQYTSFVAVDEKSAEGLEEPPRPPRRWAVPVPLPEGVRWAGIFGGPGGGPAPDGGFLYDEAKKRDIFKSLDPAKPQSTLMPPTKAPAEQNFRFPGGSSPMSGEFLQRGAAVHSLERLGRGRLAAMTASWRQVNGIVTRPPGRTGGGAPWIVAGDAEVADHFESNYGDDLRGGRQYASYGLRQGLGKDRKKLGERAKALFEAVAEEKDALRKRALLQRAYLYCHALRSLGLPVSPELPPNYKRMMKKYLDAQGGGFADAAMAMLEELDGKLAAGRLKAEPKLKTRLELIVRDKSLREALEQVASAAKLKLDVAPGAVAEACRLLGRRSVRVAYMDLRRATAAQALDWLCAPAHLDWTVAGGTVRATAASMGGLPAPWTYDVAALAVPAAKELEGIKDWGKRGEKAAKLAAEFLAEVRGAAGSKEFEDCFWLAPGQVVVFGDAAAHGRVRRLLGELEKGAGEHGKVGRRAAERYKAREGAIEKARAAQEKGEVYGALYWSSWQLLAAAAGGELDLEALTRLQVAWRHPFAKTLAKGKTPLSAMRSAWALTESALVLPNEKELLALAARVLAEVNRPADAAAGALKKKPDDGGACVATLYALLALRNGRALGVVGKERLESYEGRVLGLLTAERKKSPIAGLRQIARALLAVPGETLIDREALAKLFDAGLGGDDLNALAALAARRTGGELWLAFRAAARRNFRNGGVSGAVVLLTNRMAKPLLPSLK